MLVLEHVRKEKSPPKKRNSWARACFRARCTQGTRISAEMEKEKLASGLALKIREHTMLNPWSCHSLKWTKMQSSPSCAVSSAIGVEFLPLWFHLRHNLRHHRKSSDAGCFRGWFSRPSLYHSSVLQHFAPIPHKDLYFGDLSVAMHANRYSLSQKRYTTWHTYIHMSLAYLHKSRSWWPFSSDQNNCLQYFFLNICSLKAPSAGRANLRAMQQHRVLGWSAMIRIKPITSPTNLQTHLDTRTAVNRRTTTC